MQPRPELVPAPLPDGALQPRGEDPVSVVDASTDDQSAPAGEDRREQARRKEILVEGEVGETPGDPLETVNAQTFEVVQAIDKALVEPVAHGYMAIFPKPVRDGIHNAVTNLDEPFVFLSFLLQFKPVQALKTLGRFVVNSTIGLGGLIDVAKNKPFNRPYVKNGFGHTLAYYGVGPGPFLYLPLIGSTTLRDFVGTLAQMPVLPLTFGKPFNDPLYIFPKATVTAIDDRAQDDERIQQFRTQSSNPYANYRSYYLRRRQAEVDVLKGLREDADVPMFDDLPADVEAKPEPGADAGPQVPVDGAAVVAE